MEVEVVHDLAGSRSSPLPVPLLHASLPDLFPEAAPSHTPGEVVHSSSVARSGYMVLRPPSAALSCFPTQSPFPPSPVSSINTLNSTCPKPGSLGQIQGPSDALLFNMALLSLHSLHSAFLLVIFWIYCILLRLCAFTYSCPIWNVLIYPLLMIRIQLIDQNPCHPS